MHSLSFLEEIKFLSMLINLQLTQTSIKKFRMIRKKTCMFINMKCIFHLTF